MKDELMDVEGSDKLTPENVQDMNNLAHLLSHPDQQTWKDTGQIAEKLRVAYPEFADDPEIKNAAQTFLRKIVLKLTTVDNIEAARELVTESGLLSSEEIQQTIHDNIAQSLRYSRNFYKILEGWRLTGLSDEDLNSPAIEESLPIGLAQVILFDPNSAERYIRQFSLSNDTVQKAIDIAIRKITSGEGPEEISGQASGVAEDGESEEEVKERKRIADSRVHIIEKMFGSSYRTGS